MSTREQHVQKAVIYLEKAMYCHRNLGRCLNQDYATLTISMKRVFDREPNDRVESPHWAFYLTRVSPETSSLGVRPFDTR